MRSGFLTPTRARTRGIRLARAAAPIIAILLLAPANVTANADPTIPPETPAAPTPEFDAMEQAQASGHPVEVVERTTETTQVMANPDGRFTLTSHARPVRARDNGAWHAIDLDLVREGDGRVRPEVSAVDIAFSGGGSGPAITIADAANKVDFYWPSPLPAPIMAGNVATYANVLPDVDLAVSASEVGFSQVLVVKNAQAAANPAVRSISMSVATEGLRLDKAPNDALSAVDAAGTPIFAGSTPVMWDSTREGDSSAPTVTESHGGQVTPVDVTATTRAGATTTSGVTDLVVTPDPNALTGHDVVYPVYIDPSLSRNKSQWIQVTTAGWTHYNTADQAGVGYCNNWNGCGGSWKSRAFFTMNVSELNTRNGFDPKIFSARFYAIQTHGAHLCVAEPVDLYLTSGFDSGTTWPGPSGSRRDQKSSAAGDQCGGAGTLDFDALSAVQLGVDQLQNWTDLTFALISPDENERLQWKRFDNNPQLVVDYSYPPNTPTDFQVSNAVYCDSKIITPDTRPTVSAIATDNNTPPLNINLWMDVINSGGIQVASMGGTNPPPPVIASGTRGYWTVPSDLGDGDFRARGQSQNRYSGGVGYNLSSPLTDPYAFTIRSAKPPKPEVSSKDYPKDYWGAAQLAPGTMNVRGTGAVGVVYTFDGASPVIPGPWDCNYTRAATGGSGWAVMHQGTATFQLPTNLTPGYHVVRAQTFTDAHALSEPSEPYVFYVAPDSGLITQRLQPDTLAPSQPAGQNISISTQANCCNVSWGGGSQLRFGGTAANQSLTLDVKTSTAGDYDLGVLLTRSADYAQVGFKLDGQPVGPANYDAYSLKVMTDYVPLGRQRFAANTVRKLTITTLGTNPNSILTRHVVGVDEIVLTPSDRTEIELTNTAGPENTRSMETDPRYSLGSQLLYTGDDTKRTFSLNFTTPKEADYALALGVTKFAGYGRFTVKVDGEPLRGTDKTPIDSSLAQPFSIQLEPGGPAPFTTPQVFHEPLGGAHLKQGAHVMEFEVSGSYRIGLDYLAVTQVSGSVDTSFAEARNNNGVTASGVVGDLDIMNNTLPAEAMATAGLGSGAMVGIRGATFTMPDWSQPKDNVIATGQTIPFDPAQRVKASAVSMLVTATCEGTPLGQARITYAEPSGTGGADQFTTPMVPAVGDWVTGTDRDTATVLPHRYTNGTLDSTVRPRIYAIFLPTDPNLTLKQITLPRYGYMPGAKCQPSLHVFAVAPVPVQPTVWVGAWQAPADAAVPSPVTAGYANQTLRTVIHPNVTGGSVRVRLANPYTNAKVTIDAATIGKHTTGSDVTAPTPVTFAASTSVDIPAGGEVTSDAVTFPAGATDLVVSIHLKNTPLALAPHHRSGTATTVFALGNQTTATTLSTATTVPGTYFVSAVDVNTTSTPTDNTGTVVVIGDQTTGTAPATSGTTWVERLTGNLQPTQGLNNASRVGNTLGHWKLNGTALDHAGTANLNGTANFVTDTDPKRGTVASFNGSPALTTTGPVIETQRSYSVAVWAKLSSNATHYTAISQGGVNAGAFHLQYSKPNNAWTFVSPSSDSGSPASYPSAIGPAPTLNTWTHLVGTFDAPTGKMSLYVNGALAGTATNNTPFASNGPLAIGGVKLAGGQITNDYRGSLSNAWAFNRAVSADEARQLSLDAPTQLTPPTATDALDELNRTTYNTPRLQSVILAVGANDLLDDNRTDPNQIKDTIRARLIKLALTDPSSLTNRTAANGALIRMHLTTIPPLGLSATDPRELARRAINDDMRLNFSDYHADQLIDIAAAVQDPTNTNLTRGTYLTTNKPNDAYHNAIVAAFNPGPGPLRF